MPIGINFRGVKGFLIDSRSCHERKKVSTDDSLPMSHFYANLKLKIINSNSFVIIYAN
jgi:hypothetical protein